MASRDPSCVPTQHISSMRLSAGNVGKVSIYRKARVVRRPRAWLGEVGDDFVIRLRSCRSKILQEDLGDCMPAGAIPRRDKKRYEYSSIARPFNQEIVRRQ